jgi:hypothetical protein
MPKILEYKNLDWFKGISAHVNAALGGLFQALKNCDPFEYGGLAMPGRTPAHQTLSSTPKFLTNFNSSGSNYVYVHTDSALYQVLKDSPYTVTDVTNQINQHLISSGTMTKIIGRTKWKGKLIYAIQSSTGDGYIQANTFPVASGSDQTLQRDFTNNLDHMPMEVGADGNLYCGNDSRIYEQTTAAGTANGTTQTGNGTQFLIDSGFYVRDLVNDGRYLVIFADNNAQNISDRLTGNYECKVYFWDMVQTDANGRIVCDAIWTFTDSYVIGAKLLDNAIIMLTYNGMWVTNVATYPKMFRAFPTNTALMGRPLNPSQIGARKGSIFWCDGFTNTIHDVFAYGNPVTGQQKIFYRPYDNGGTDVLSTCLLPVGDQLIVGTDQPGLWFYNVTSQSRGAVGVTSLDTNMPAPFKYEFIKVVLGQKVASGQQVQVNSYGNGGNDLISSEIQVFSGAGGTVVGAKHTLKFNRVLTTTNQPEKFEDLTVSVTADGVPIQRLTVYGTPNDDANVEL